jgi:hypothetical protein
LISDSSLLQAKNMAATMIAKKSIFFMAKCFKVNCRD